MGGERTFLVISSVIYLLSSVFAQGQDKGPYRICVLFENLDVCEQMLNSTGSTSIKCIGGIDKINCIEKISKNEADFLPVEAEEAYVAYRFLKDGFRVITEIRSAEFKDRDFQYEPVAIARKSSGIKSISDLKGKKSCHTGFGRNAGWKIPFSHLMDKGQLPKYCEEIKAPTTEKDLYAISNYFGSACAPGEWIPEREKDHELKQKYPNLCELCENPVSCKRDDKFGGYAGALKCLTMKGGDVAWTKMDAVVTFFNLSSPTISPISSEYQFLCWDGSSLPLNSPNPCSWARRPWASFVATNRLSTTAISQLQQEITSVWDKGVAEAKSSGIIPSWLRFVLEIGQNPSSEFDIPTHLDVHVAKRTTPLVYLDRGKNYSVTIEKPSCATDTSIKFCVESELEKSKCLALQLAAVGRRILPRLECVLGESNLDCIQKVGNGDADLVNLDPKDSDWAQKNYDLIPVLSEVEGTHNPEESGPFRFSLAVIRASDASLYNKNISNLKGKRSCHSSIKSVSGWNSPINGLRKLGLISGPTCGLSLEMSSFFGNKSCVPGTKELAISTIMPWLPTNKLCALCAGDGIPPGKAFTPETVCQADESERYFGALGALRCVTENVGDVAFVDHVGLHWEAIKSGEIKEADILLLCPNGSTFDVKNYQHCNWGKIPSNQILVRGGEDFEIKREDVKQTLLKIGSAFNPDNIRTGNVLRLFGSYFGNKNLLFQDTSRGLCFYEDSVEYRNLISDYDYCTTSNSMRLLVGGCLSGLLLVFLRFL